jgi:thioesterase domain-containing protein
MWEMIRGRVIGGSRIDTAAMTLAHHLVDRPVFRPLLRVAARVLPAHVPVGTNRHLSRLAFAMKRNLRMSFQRALGRAWRPDATLSGTDVTLFRGAGHDGLPPDLGWARLCPHLTCIDIPGAHHEMFEQPNLAVLCSTFETALTDATVPAWSHQD